MVVTNLMIFQVRGVAYRGRILVEVISTLDKTLPKTIVQDIDSSEWSRKIDLNNNSITQCYKLFGVFLCANAVQPGNKEVEFEISIGKP